VDLGVPDSEKVH